MGRNMSRSGSRWTETVVAVLLRGVAYFCWWVAAISTSLTVLALALELTGAVSVPGAVLAFWLPSVIILVALGWLLLKLANRYDPEDAAQR